MKENPRVIVLFRDAKTKAAWRFHGTATLHEDGPIRDQVMGRTVKEEFDKDPERKGAAVVIRLDKITNMGDKSCRPVSDPSCSGFATHASIKLARKFGSIATARPP